MTKKLQPTRSLRSLLFGGPQLQYVVELSMEDCLQQLKSLQATGQLGQHDFEQMEINDQGRAIRWKLRLADPNVPISGSFTLKAEQQVHLRIRLGPPIRQLYFQVGVVIALVLSWVLPIGIAALWGSAGALNRWISSPEGIALGTFSLCIIVSALGWIALTIGRFPDEAIQRNLIQEFSQRFPMKVDLQPTLTNSEFIPPGWKQLFKKPELEYLTQRPLDACVGQLRSIEASGIGENYKVSPIEFNNREDVVGWSFWIYPKRIFNHTPYRVRVGGSFTPVEDGRIYVQVQIGPPLRASIVAGLYVVVVFGCALSWIRYEQLRVSSSVPVWMTVIGVGFILLVSVLLLAAASGAPVGFVPPVTKSRILYHLKQRLMDEHSA